MTETFDGHDCPTQNILPSSQRRYCYLPNHWRSHNSGTVTTLMLFDLTIAMEDINTSAAISAMESEPLTGRLAGIPKFGHGVFPILNALAASSSTPSFDPLGRCKPLLPERSPPPNLRSLSSPHPLLATAASKRARAVLEVVVTPAEAHGCSPPARMEQVAGGST